MRGRLLEKDSKTFTSKLILFLDILECKFHMASSVTDVCLCNCGNAEIVLSKQIKMSKFTSLVWIFFFLTCKIDHYGHSFFELCFCTRKKKTIINSADGFRGIISVRISSNFSWPMKSILKWCFGLKIGTIENYIVLVCFLIEILLNVFIS